MDVGGAGEIGRGADAVGAVGVRELEEEGLAVGGAGGDGVDGQAGLELGGGGVGMEADGAAVVGVQGYGVELRCAVDAVTAGLEDAADPAVEQVGDAVGVDDVAVALEAVRHARRRRRLPWTGW